MKVPRLRGTKWQSKNEILSISEWYLDAQRKISQLNKASEEYGLTYDQFLVLSRLLNSVHNRPGQLQRNLIRHHLPPHVSWNAYKISTI